MEVDFNRYILAKMRQKMDSCYDAEQLRFKYGEEIQIQNKYRLKRD